MFHLGVLMLRVWALSHTAINSECHLESTAEDSSYYRTCHPKYQRPKKIILGDRKKMQQTYSCVALYNGQLLSYYLIFLYSQICWRLSRKNIIASTVQMRK